MSTEVVYLQRCWLDTHWCHVKLHLLCTPYNHASCFKRERERERDERERDRERERREREREREERERERGRREREKGRERENSNSKILIYKDCSSGSVKNLPNN